MTDNWNVDNYRLVGLLEETVFGRPMRWVTYVPADTPGAIRAYQVFKRRIRRHPWISVLLGGAAFAAVGALYDDWWKFLRDNGEIIGLGLGAAASGMTVLDRRIDPSPESQVRHTFDGLDDLWSQAYGAAFSERPTRDQVDRFVRLARNPSYILDDITRSPDPEGEAKRLGVVVSLAADLLTAWSAHNSCRQVDPGGILRSVLGEKCWQPEDEQALGRIRDRHEFRKLLGLLEVDKDAGDDPDIDRLEDLLRNPDLQLRVHLPGAFPLHHFGTQMSRGSVRVVGVPGNSSFSYLGRHSEDSKPYVFFQDGAGAYCASNQQTGLVIVNGPAGREASKDMRGGVALYLDQISTGIFVRMDGPAVGVLYRPIDPESVGPVKNGTVLFLEQGPSPRRPTARRYVEGRVAEEVELTDFDSIGRWVARGVGGAETPS